ncbi:Csu type fimbrial protein [Lysobacter enzymogenes]|uniref:Csu type fimbrial protein n=1 Tax=Lysobacter enzymogenes TaxID=69 RepID=UPI002B4000F0|nr:spore coat U domain-containing protein [Lysobacter enzymogenes]
MLLLWLLALAGLLFAPSAWAQSCTIGNNNADFGQVGSVAVFDTDQRASGSASIRCVGLNIAWGTSNTITGTMHSNNNFQLRSAAGGPSIPYALYANSDYATGLFQQDVPNSSTNYGGNLIPFIGGASGSYTLYARTFAGANVPAGRYTDTVNVIWNARICTLGFILCLAWSDSASASTVAVTLDVVNDCTMNAPNLDFGAAPLVGGFAPASQTVQIRCTSGSAYTVGLSDGNNFNGGWRRMRQGVTASYLNYELYKSVSSSDRWGSLGAQRRNSATADLNPSVHDGTTFQSFTYRGVVDPAQATPPAGAYTDNIVVDVQF